MRELREFAISYHRDKISISEIFTDRRLNRKVKPVRSIDELLTEYDENPAMVIYTELQADESFKGGTVINYNQETSGEVHVNSTQFANFLKGLTARYKMHKEPRDTNCILEERIKMPDGTYNIRIDKFDYDGNTMFGLLFYTGKSIEDGGFTVDFNQNGEIRHLVIHAPEGYSVETGDGRTLGEVYQKYGSHLLEIDRIISQPELQNQYPVLKKLLNGFIGEEPRSLTSQADLGKPVKLVIPNRNS